MLEPHERLFIARQRMNEGLNQEEYARHYYKVGAATYRPHENGKKPIPESWKIPDVGELTEVERYIVLRRRHFKNRIEMAAAMRAAVRPDLPAQTQKYFTTITVRRILDEETENVTPIALAAWWGSQEV